MSREGVGSESGWNRERVGIKSGEVGGSLRGVSLMVLFRFGVQGEAAKRQQRKGV